MPNIAIVCDFDNTLTLEDSTSIVVQALQQSENANEFWDYIYSLTKNKNIAEWEHILACEAPTWMYALSQIARKKRVPLNTETFKFIAPLVELQPHARGLIEETKKLSERKAFKDVNLHIHHFIVSAGLKDLIEQVLSKHLITWTFGCRYEVIFDPFRQPESIPVYCMDETMKTRSLFEISKGSFSNKHKSVNKRVEKSELWAPFENIIYIGDGPSDIPALSLTRDRGGIGIAVYDPRKSAADIQKRFKEMRLDKRADLITPADFSESGELFGYIVNRCHQIRQRYEAESVI